MKQKTELLAIALILLAFTSGMVLTAATSGCGSDDPTRQGSSTAALNGAAIGPAQPLPHGVGWNQE